MQFGLRSADPLLHARYSQLKQDVATLSRLLPGSPGSLQKGASTGNDSHWYRHYIESSGKPAKRYVGPLDDLEKYEYAQAEIAAANQIKKVVISLRKDGYQVLPRDFARVFVELFNRGIVGASPNTLVLTGTIAFMSILNDNGLLHTSAKTLDIDLAYDRRLKLAVQESLESAVKSALDDIVTVPGLPSHQPSTSLKRRGINMLSIDLLTEGAPIGKAIPIDALSWHAQGIPHLQFLIEESDVACVLAGHQGIMCRVPNAVRFALTKLYSAASKTRSQDKSLKDYMQANLLLRWLMQDDPETVAEVLHAAPGDIQKSVKRSLKNLERDGIPNIELLT